MKMGEMHLLFYLVTFSRSSPGIGLSKKTMKSGDMSNAA